MSALVASGLDRISGVYSVLGLNTIPIRFAATTAFFAVLLFIIKPSSLFYEGRAKVWSIFDSGLSDGAEPVASTIMPWYLVAVLAGLFSITFV